MKLNFVYQKLGIDRSISYTVLNRIIQGGGNLFVLFFISRFLSKTELGYYYTFGSIAAMQVFFELGLSVVVTQFVAHEFAFLSLDEHKNAFNGKQEHIGRLASLLRFIAKWYVWGSCIFFLVITPIGLFFFETNHHSDIDVFWEGPWLLLMIGTSFNLLVSPYIPFIEGLNRIGDTSRFRMLQSTVALFVQCLCIAFGLGLWSLGIFALSNFFLVLLWLNNSKFKNIFRFIWLKFDPTIAINWKNEIFPFQWRIALSWLSGYFIFQIFNPIIFAVDGPILAGQLGITITAFNGISIIAIAWINTKVPTFSILIANKKFAELDSLFFRALKQSFILIALAAITILFVISTLQSQDVFAVFRDMASRFLPLKQALFIGMTTITNHLIFSMAAYLRSHKKEPLFLNSLIGAIITAPTIYFSAEYFGITGAVVANCFITTVVGLSWTTIVFFSKRKIWHTLI